MTPKNSTMPAMAVEETPLAAPINSHIPLCRGDNHIFLIAQAPPGTLCDCGKKVRIYEPCAVCGQRKASIADVKTLQEDY